MDLQQKGSKAYDHGFVAKMKARVFLQPELKYKSTLLLTLEWKWILLQLILRSVLGQQERAKVVYCIQPKIC